MASNLIILIISNQNLRAIAFNLIAMAIAIGFRKNRILVQRVKQALF